MKAIPFPRFAPHPPDLDPLRVLGWALVILGAAIAGFGALFG